MEMFWGDAFVGSTRRANQNGIKVEELAALAIRRSCLFRNACSSWTSTHESWLRRRNVYEYLTIEVSKFNNTSHDKPHTSMIAQLFPR
jgi:hypothetical protein